MGLFAETLLLLASVRYRYNKMLSLTMDGINFFYTWRRYKLFIVILLRFCSE